MRFLATCVVHDDTQQLIDRLEALGLHIDRGYPPVVVDPASGRVALRGEGPLERLEQARIELGMEVFVDPAIGILPAS